MDWAIPDGTGLWQAALAVIPLVIVCNVLCRLLPMRAATRHTLWVATLLAMILPLVLPKAPPVSLPEWTSASTASIKPNESTNPPTAIPAPLEIATAPDRPIELGHDADVTTQSKDQPAAMQSGADKTSASGLTASGIAPRVPTPVHTAPLPKADKPTSPRLNGLAARSRSATPRSSVPARAPSPEVEKAAPPVAAIAPAQPLSMPEPIAAPAQSEDVGSWLLAGRATIATWFVAWIGAFRWARDGLAQIPAVPPQIWLGGLALLIGIQALRIAAFCRRLKRGIPAPAGILRAVDEVAASLGMKRTPRTLIINERISPLIWCGRKPTLILPFGLWTQLDKHGKRAILAHELAHLQRLDHWVCWFEQAVTLLYWWHPLVWWIRKRIHEEADLSCDAWVTWLMPQGRRAYAEALLRTKQFVSANGADVPAGGMAAASGRAREFARRLTMVMTHSARPRRSMTGIVLATTIAAAGWIAAPAWSCPPGQEKAQKTYSENKVETRLVTTDGTVHVITNEGQTATVNSKDGVTVISSAKPATAGKTDKVGVKFHPAPIESFSPFTSTVVTDPVSVPQPMWDYTWTTTPMVFGSGGGLFLAQAQDQGQGTGDQERLAKLEAELHRISEQLAELKHGQHGGSGGHAPVATPTAPMLPRQPAPPAQPAQPPQPGQAPRAAMRAPIAVAQGGEEVVRSYELPQAKLDALYALMVRDDVPVRVSRDGNKINVHGTEAQQEVFAAFIEMINSGGVRARTPSGMGGVSGGVGGGIRPSNRSMTGGRRLAPTAPGTPAPSRGGARRADAAAEKSLVEALAQAGNTDGKPEEVARKMLEKAELWRVAAQSGSEEARRKVEQVAQKLRSLGAVKQADIEKYTQLAESMGQQAEQHAVQAQELLEQVAKLTAEKVDSTMREKAKTLEKAAKEMEAKARELEKKAAEWEKKASEAESQADRVNEQADELNEMIESFDENSTDDADNDNDEDIDDAAPTPAPQGVSLARPAAAPAAACEAFQAEADCKAKAAADCKAEMAPKPADAAVKCEAAPAAPPIAKPLR